jgi:hypothetical protein
MSKQHTQGPWSIAAGAPSHYGEPTYLICAPGPIGQMAYEPDATLAAAAPSLAAAVLEVIEVVYSPHCVDRAARERQLEALLIAAANQAGLI